MRKFAVAVLFAFVASIVMAQIPGAVPFTGDMTMKPKSGESMSGKMYFSGSKMRWDMSMRGHDSVMITDIPGKVSYMLMPQQHMYMEMRAGQNMQRGPKMDSLKSYDPNNPCATSEDMTCEKAGSETINGRSTDKWIFKKKSTGKLVMTAWLDKKIHFPIKSVMEDGSEMDLTNVQEGAPAASVFEIPAGYKKFDMGSMMRGQMPSGKDDQ